jgi:hypothetical protein
VGVERGGENAVLLVFGGAVLAFVLAQMMQEDEEEGFWGLVLA